MGPLVTPIETPLFTPEYEQIINQPSNTKDLGVLIDSDARHLSQRNSAIKKCANKCSWILRTFQCRDPEVLKLLWKSLARPHLDYCALQWAPTNQKGQLAALEAPLRAYTKRFEGFQNLNYWQRLAKAKLQSCQRRNDRYRLLYIFKSIYGHAPSLGLKTTTDKTRNGIKIEIPKISGSVQSIISMKENSINIYGARIFNSLPNFLRNITNDFNLFKYCLDKYLEDIPDQPVLQNYSSHNLDKNLWQSNCLLDWNINLKMNDWYCSHPKSNDGG